MSYTRTIPRDLFNEANLLKCYGQLWLRIEALGLDPEAHLVHVDPRDPFEVDQDPTDGGLSLRNVEFYIGAKLVRLNRPLNSRDPYPLYAYPEPDEEVSVFTDAGEFTPEMRALLKGRAA